MRFDELLGHRIGCASLDNLLRQLRANKDEALRVLEYPATQLDSNLTADDNRTQVTPRKMSFGTRSASGPAFRDACLGELEACKTLGVPQQEYLRDCSGVAGAPNAPRLADLMTQRATA